MIFQAGPVRSTECFVLTQQLTPQGTVDLDALGLIFIDHKMAVQGLMGINMECVIFLVKTFHVEVDPPFSHGLFRTDGILRAATSNRINGMLCSLFTIGFPPL